MVSFKRMFVKNKWYLYAYQGKEYLCCLGPEDKHTPEELNYIKRKLNEQIKARKQNAKDK